MAGILNPYAARSKEPRYRFVRNTLLAGFLLLVAVAGRGYHRRKTRAIRGGRNGTKQQNQKQKQQKQQQARVIGNPVPNRIQTKAVTEKVDVRQEEEEKEPPFVPIGSPLNSMDDVSDSLGAAAEDAGKWIQQNALSGLLGDDLADQVGGIVDAGFDQVGGLVDAGLSGDVVGSDHLGSMVKQLSEWFERERNSEADDEKDEGEEDGVVERNEEESEGAQGKEDDSGDEINEKDEDLHSGDKDLHSGDEEEEEDDEDLHSGDEEEEEAIKK